MKKFNFIHVPRCAGMSFFYFLEDCLGKSSCIRFGDANSVRLFYEQPDAGFLSNYSLVSGHLTITDFYQKGLINENRITFSFIRDPLEQLKSIIIYTLENRYPEHNQYCVNDYDSSQKIRKIISDVYENSTYLGLYNTITKEASPQEIVAALYKMPKTFIFSMHHLGPVAMEIRGEQLFFPVPTNESSPKVQPNTKSIMEEEIELYTKGHFFQKNRIIYEILLNKSEKNLTEFSYCINN